MKTENKKLSIMKTKLLFSIGLLTATIAFGSNKTTSKPDKTVKNNDSQNTLPVFAWNKVNDTEFEGKSPFLIYSYLRENVQYPDVALKYNIQGTEVVQFTVTANGEVKNIKVVNSVSPEIDAEVTEAISNTSGMWEPGLKNGVPVDMEREISLAFQISGFRNNHFLEKATHLINKGNKALILQNNPKKALKYFDKALRYQPYESTILNSRSIARYMLNDKEGAQQDLNRMDAILAAKSEKEKNLQFYTENAGDLKVNQENLNNISK